MTELKKYWIFLLVFLVLVPLLPVIFVAVAWTFVGVGTWIFTPNPPRPEITYGEFPFELVYKIEGETRTVNDVYICEYDGLGCNTGVGKYRKWKNYVKSTGEEEIILYAADGKVIYCYIGSAKYYMDDEEYSGRQSPEPIYYLRSGDEPMNDVRISIDELRRKYKVEIIDWTLAEPIENSFKYFWQ